MYEKGRADERKDFEDLEMGLSKEEARRIEQETYERAYKEGWDKGYSDGHFIGGAKAIDEFLNHLLNDIPFVSLQDEIECRKIFIGIAEQLKERSEWQKE